MKLPCWTRGECELQHMDFHGGAPEHVLPQRRALPIVGHPALSRQFLHSVRIKHRRDSTSEATRQIYTLVLAERTDAGRAPVNGGLSFAPASRRRLGSAIKKVARVDKL